MLGSLFPCGNTRVISLLQYLDFFLHWMGATFDRCIRGSRCKKQLAACGEFVNWKLCVCSLFPFSFGIGTFQVQFKMSPHP